MLHEREENKCPKEIKQNTNKLGLKQIACLSVTIDFSCGRCMPID